MQTAPISIGSPVAELIRDIEGRLDAEAEAERDRARELLHELGAAKRALEHLVPVVVRARCLEQRPTDRRPHLVCLEVERACRLAAEIAERLERARQALPAIPPQRTA